MKAEVHSKFPVLIEQEGTVMDFADGEFVFLIKDESWTPHELSALKQKPLCIEFVYKFDIAIFLLTIEDALDTSDFIFNVHDNTYGEELFSSFEKGEGYACALYLLDKENVVQGRKFFRLPASASALISQKLRQQRAQVYREEEFLCNLEGLQSAYEPFELQPLAIVHEQIK